MNFFDAIILGIVEGITEFLPISSTGHLILTTDLMRIESTEFVKSFTVIIQLGAILSVLTLYWRKFLTKKNLLYKVLTAFMPTAIVGFMLYPFIKDYLLGSTQVTLWALFLGGILLIGLEMWFLRSKMGNNKTDNNLTVSAKQALIIGLFQSISVIPGTSRALATIFGGMIVGLSRKNAVEFSFLLAIPTMLAATGLDLLETSFIFTNQEWVILTVGFITSFIVAYVVIKWFIKYVSNHSFIIFGVYRILLAILLYFVLI